MPRKGQKLTEEQKQKKRDMWAAMSPEQRKQRTKQMRNLSPEKESLRRQKLSESTARLNKTRTMPEGMNTKIVFTEEMLVDLRMMGDKNFSKKWNIDRGVVIRRRKELNIPSFNKQYGTQPHLFVGVAEFKWCQHGHWEVVENFGIDSTRIDGLRGWCKQHVKQIGSKYYYTNDRVTYARNWTKTPTGKLSKRMTWRKQSAKKKNAYVQWSRADEQFIFDKFNGRCAYCNTPLDINTCEFDHFIPIALGGKTQPSNMLPSCVSCNHGTDGKFALHPQQHLSQDKYNYLSSVLNNLRPQPNTAKAN